MAGSEGAPNSKTNSQLTAKPKVSSNERSAKLRKGIYELKN